MLPQENSRILVLTWIALVLLFTASMPGLYFLGRIWDGTTVDPDSGFLRYGVGISCFTGALSGVISFWLFASGRRLVAILLLLWLFVAVTGAIWGAPLVHITPNSY